MKAPYIICITGGSGSGKTTFIQRIRAAFSEKELCIISQDDYYRPREEQMVDKEGVINFDLPKAIDKESFIRDILLLASGNQVSRPQYNFNNDKATSQMLTFLPAPVIIVEGLFVFHFKKIRKLCDLKIFFHAKDNLKVIRRIKRDQEQRNYPLEDVLYRYEHHVLPAFEKYINPYREKADIIINNNKSFDKAYAILFSFIKDCIKERKG
ncbi:MAG TPA: uridine kinase [Phaeodactylibacter sp.]|nr:uridine kinase [Phaeodactylibacter sp.]